MCGEQARSCLTSKRNKTFRGGVVWIDQGIGIKWVMKSKENGKEGKKHISEK
jgi:hypothetical protein